MKNTELIILTTIAVLLAIGGIYFYLSTPEKTVTINKSETESPVQKQPEPIKTTELPKNTEPPKTEKTQTKHAPTPLDITPTQRTGIRDAAIKSIVLGIRAAAEIEYSNDISKPSYKNLCASDYVKRSSDINLTCRSTEKDYVAYAQLSNGNYYCTDRLAQTTERTSEPQGLTCSK